MLVTNTVWAIAKHWDKQNEKAWKCSRNKTCALESLGIYIYIKKTKLLYSSISSSLAINMRIPKPIRLHFGAPAWLSISFSLDKASRREKTTRRSHQDRMNAGENLIRERISISISTCSILRISHAISSHHPSLPTSFPRPQLGRSRKFVEYLRWGWGADQQFQLLLFIPIYFHSTTKTPRITPFAGSHLPQI